MKTTMQQKATVGLFISFFGFALMGYASAFSNNPVAAETVGLIGWIVVLAGLFLALPAIIEFYKRVFPQETGGDQAGAKIDQVSTKLANGAYLSLPATTVLITSVQLDVEHLMSLVTEYVRRSKELHQEALAINQLLNAIMEKDAIKIAYWSGRVDGVPGLMVDALELSPKLSEPVISALSKQKGAIDEWERRYLQTAQNFIQVAGRIQTNLIHLKNKAETSSDKALIDDAQRKVGITRGLFNFPVYHRDEV